MGNLPLHPFFELCCTVSYTPPSDLRCTPLSYTPPCWATLRLTELRCTHWAALHPIDLQCPFLTNTASQGLALPNWATLYPTVLCCTLLSCPTPCELSCNLTELSTVPLCNLLKCLTLRYQNKGTPVRYRNAAAGMRCWMPEYRCHCPAMNKSYGWFWKK
jgi:hypothetical protein